MATSVPKIFYLHFEKNEHKNKNLHIRIEASSEMYFLSLIGQFQMNISNEGQIHNHIKHSNQTQIGLLFNISNEKREELFVA